MTLQFGRQQLKMQGAIWSFTYFVPYLKKKKEMLGSHCNWFSFQQNKIHTFPVIFHHNLKRESHKPQGPPTSVTWLLLPRNQTNTGTFTALVEETVWPERTRFAHFEQELAKVTCAWRWRICGINPATPTHIGGLLMPIYGEDGPFNDMTIWQRRSTSPFPHVVRAGIGSTFFKDMDRQRRSYYLVNKFPTLYNTWFLLLPVLKERYVCFIIAYCFAPESARTKQCHAYGYTHHAYTCVDWTWIQIHARVLTAVNCSGQFTKTSSPNLL